MTLLIHGVYRDGVFHPNEPVALPNNTPVAMTVEIDTTDEVSEVDEAERKRREFHELLVAAGLVRPGHVPGLFKSSLSPERQAELARKLAEAGPIYDIIREERDSN